MWNQWYKLLNGQTIISEKKKVGWHKLTFDNKQDYLNAGCPDRIKWVNDAPVVKDETEMVNEYWKASYRDMLGSALMEYFSTKYNTDQKIGLLDLDKYGNNSQKTASKAIRDWMHDVQMVDFATRLSAVNSATTLAELQAVSMDFTDNDATKPPYDYLDVLAMT